MFPSPLPFRGREIPILPGFPNHLVEIIPKVEPLLLPIFLHPGYNTAKVVLQTKTKLHIVVHEKTLKRSVPQVRKMTTKILVELECNVFKTPEHLENSSH